MPDVSRRPNGFTLVELLVVIAIIAILASLLMPGLSKAKAKANSIKCLNDIRQLGLSASLYAGDHDGEYPRRMQWTNSWVATLKPYYKTASLLACPSDRFIFTTGNHERRSYLFNGFNDFWQKTLSDANYRRVMAWNYPHGMKEAAIPLASDTILFGEKRTGSYHVHMDFGQLRGNDREEVNQNMHKDASGKKSGGSNFLFVDGSARKLKYGGSVQPINLWAITDEWRNAPVELP
ncbi:MAG: type II secretion system protein [Verrucomicrobiota bacterium]